MFLAILIFDLNWTFFKGYSHCMGYRLCKVADFKNRLISRIFDFVSSGFLHGTTLVFLYNHFAQVLLAILIFDPNWPFCKGFSLCMGYSLCKMAESSKSFYFSNIWCLFQRFFVPKNSSVLIHMFFACFLHILIFDPNWPFCKGYSLCMGYSLCKMAEFQNRLISRIIGVFSRGFLHRKTLLCL